MQKLYARFATLAGLVVLLGVVVVTAPKPVHASECVCEHWSGLDGPCDDACKAGYTYCQGTGGIGFFSGDNGLVQGPCADFKTTQICDNLFGCLVCTEYSGDCGGGGD